MSMRLPPTLGFAKLLAVSIALFALLELLGWPLAILAGIIIGLLASRWRDAVLAGALGCLIGWSLYLMAYGLAAGVAVAKALALLRDFVAITLLLGLALGSLSSSIGFLALDIWRRARARETRAQEAEVREAPEVSGA